MTSFDPDVTAFVLARGLVEAQERAIAEVQAIQQDASMPPRLRQGLTMLSGLCLMAGAEDLGASLHVAMDRACTPFADWGVPQFQAPFRFADVVLIDREPGIPTPDCRELAALGGNASAAQEEINFEILRGAVAKFPARQRDALYTAIREFIVRNPIVSYAVRTDFIEDRGLVAAAASISEFYGAIPQAALFDGAARRCGHCGGLLWPHRDTRLYPDGICRIRQCEQAHPTPRRGDEIRNPAEWLLAKPATLNYWVGPGLDEIRIHDALKRDGRNVVLYPFGDSADVGVDGEEIGIDVKAYASPVLLASRLSRSIGRLARFRRRILAVPDDRLTYNRRYLEQLEDLYSGEHRLQFMTVSRAILEARQ